MEPKVLIISASSEIGGAEKVALDTVELLKNEFDFALLNQSSGDFSLAFENLKFPAFAFSLPAWRKGKNFVSKWIAVLKLAFLVKKQKINLVHCNSFRLAPYLYWAMKLTGVRGFIHLHEFASKKQLKNFYVFKFKDVLTVSNAVAQAAGVSYFKVIRNAVDIQKFYPHASRRKDIVVGLIAHFNPVKRHKLFIQIAGEIKKVSKEFRFVIVGDDKFNTGISRQSLEAFSRECGLTECDITFVGATDKPYDYMRCFDVFLLTSEQETFGIVLLEAMASGCIVFADKKAGGPSEIIADSVDGFLIDCAMVQESAEKIKNVMSDLYLRKEIVKNALIKIEKEYTLKSFSGKISNYYKEVLKG